ncbi:hypothetical protein GE21DRAFT_7073 [Neurospora crassa]|uniref:RING-type E3 ubiquitin transferase n=2 Tax=Neurospora crassa TaxID=5141 RepID=Q1K6H9_NEUCR|nr:RING finger protein [Neurospora crassa OR74A]EAA29940.1 RING finger protein [Neurospora crassa OR74A]KHE83446.1 hypothetical protein GE21DRAFT_7073 [Neurospora crassa]CAD37003.1 conserved hypothetical protein [Neurospora crassa]|eukprot:XP_959176.1 RING finger protein [Neurospora crassa OR74A]
MRLAWYAGCSTALAASVILSAFHQRANFYSAVVHLGQSSLSLVVLVNLIFVLYGAFMYGLQRLCFGPLRPVEIEQLYERAWFAVTETCLAMTIFREEVGPFFLCMFTALVTGKVWGWIGEGRVEVFEQQPPANPRLFHTRLSVSLLLSVAYNVWMLKYCIDTVVQQARPTMMVMFLFEFAIQTVTSSQTAIRYLFSMWEQHITRVQTRNGLEQRRRQIRERRAEILRRREQGDAEAENEELPSEDDVEEMDIEVPGWDAKGLYILSLDLVSDFLKLCIYTAFFGVLITFYGLPIHIIRDWFMTTRSFIKRLNALLRYRQATRDMDQYADATEQDLGQDDTCIICREEMRPWDPHDPVRLERTRAKKLPCGHILHQGCLKSWLERQQVCPTCRRPVSREGQQPNRNDQGGEFNGLNHPAGQNQQPQQQINGQAPANQNPNGLLPGNQRNHQNNGVRMFNLGPIRLGFAQGQDIQEMARRMGIPEDMAHGHQRLNAQAPPPPSAQQPVNGHGATGMEQIQAQLVEVGQRLDQELRELSATIGQFRSLQNIATELARVRHAQQTQALGVTLPHEPVQIPPFPQNITRHGAADWGTAIPAGSPDLPEGVVIPEGWSLLPLERLDGGAVAPGQNSGQVDQAGQQEDGNTATPGTSTAGPAPEQRTVVGPRSDNTAQSRAQIQAQGNTAPSLLTTTPPSRPITPTTPATPMSPAEQQQPATNTSSPKPAGTVETQALRSSEPSTSSTQPQSRLQNPVTITPAVNTGPLGGMSAGWSFNNVSPAPQPEASQPSKKEEEDAEADDRLSVDVSESYRPRPRPAPAAVEDAEDEEASRS